MSGPKITLDQWRALINVVDAGSYSAAAEQMHKSQSTISYAIQKIEQQLAVKIFNIEGRKAVLTVNGEALLRRGRALVADAERLEQAAAGMASGWAPDMAIAADAIFPTWIMLECMAAFSRDHPETRIELYESVLDGTNELLLEGLADIAITSLVPPGFLADPLMQVRTVAVAAPAHALHGFSSLGLEELRGHRHILIRDSGKTRSRTPAWQGADQRWTVSHKATSIRAVCEGHGFAWFPEEVIRSELESGQLKPLPLAEGAVRYNNLYLVLADGEKHGLAVSAFCELLKARVRECPGSQAPDK